MSQPTKVCSYCQTSMDVQAQFCTKCGKHFETQTQYQEPTNLGTPQPPPYQTPPQPFPVYPPPYQQPGPPVYQPVPVFMAPVRRTDACAVVSVVFSTLGLLMFCCFGWVFSGVGSILGLVSLIRLAGDPDLDGKALAWLGLILGAAPVIFWLVVMAISSTA